MARPRIIKLPDGEVSLSGFPKEVADELQAHIEAFTTLELAELAPPHVQSAVVPPFTLVVDGVDFSSKAIGLHQDGREYRLVVVGYDLESKEARVEEVKEPAMLKDASTQFKVKADRLKFV